MHTMLTVKQGYVSALPVRIPPTIAILIVILGGGCCYVILSHCRHTGTGIGTEVPSVPVPEPQYAYKSRDATTY